MFWNVRPIAARGDRVRRLAGDVLAEERRPARRRLVDAGQHVEERRLARAVRPDQRDHLAARHREVDVVDRDEAAELLAHARSATRTSVSLIRPRIRLSARDVVERLVVDALVELGGDALRRDQALRPEEHDEQDDQPVDARRVQRHVEVRVMAAEVDVRVDPRAGVREALLVQVGEERAADDHAPDVPHPAEDDHAEDEHRDVEVEVAGERRALEDGVVRAGDAAEERAARVRPRLRPHQRDAHRRRGGLVLADRDPGAAEPRVLQPQRAEDREEQQHDRGPEEDVGRLDLVAEIGRVAALQVVRGQEAAGPVREAVAEADRVDRRDPVRAVRQVEAGAEEVVAVARDLREDLAEAERHDREVVAAQAQRRQADHDPEERGDDAGERQQRARSRRGSAGQPIGIDRRRAPKCQAVVGANCCDANQAAVYAPVA